MNIKTIREKYPQYSDLTDKKLVDALHAKFYKDIPIKQFYAKVGFVETTPIKSINSTQSNINNTQVIQNQSQNFKTANGWRVPLTDLLAFFPSKNHSLSFGLRLLTRQAQNSFFRCNFFVSA